MLVRKLARAMIAVPFVVDGIDAARRPAGHVDPARAALTRLDSVVSRRCGHTLPDVPEAQQLTSLVRFHGAMTALAGFALAKGIAPRTSAFGLALLTAPLVAADLPGALSRTGDDGAPLAPGERRERRRRLAIRVALLGAAVLAAVDREGRPGPAWRIEHALEQRHTAAEA